MGCQASSADQGAHGKPGHSNSERGSTGAMTGSSSSTGGFGGDSKVLDGKKNVMGKYEMSMSKDDFMGEGTSSLCRKGIEIATQNAVAIKVYKKGASKQSAKDSQVMLLKFKRQISVLKELLEPLEKPKDPKLWCDQLAKATPANLFMQVFDYSKDASNEPGPDVSDGVLYVVTELAQYSLKDYLSLRREQCRPLSRTSIHNISKTVILVMSGLHAKGLVHIDLKPENMMMFNARLKLIDVDGCVKVGTAVSISDSSISFSPCYCAPEWAKFLIEEEDSRIQVQPHLDVWSVGMTLCELVTLDAILKPMYASYLRTGHSNREAGFLFMEWLSSIKSPPLPRAVERFDPGFLQLIKEGLCVCDPKQRRTLAQCLGMPYILTQVEKDGKDKDGNEEKPEAVIPRKVRCRGEDQTTHEPLYKGTLWKLQTDGNPSNLEHWLKRDMWIASNGAFCYFSLKEEKRLVFLDQVKLSKAEIEDIDGKARGSNAFQLKIPGQDDKPPTMAYFACDAKSDLDNWKRTIEGVKTMEILPQTMRFDEGMVKDLKAFRLAVKNRRAPIADADKAKYEPTFKAKLWKVKQDGDKTKEPDWFEREMWVSKNHCVVYYSKKEEKDLVYYNSDDLKDATIKRLENSDSFKPWAFQVWRQPVAGVSFDPGEFAGVSEAERETWIKEFEALASLNK